MAGDQLTVGEALTQHLRAAGLPTDSGVSLRWVVVRFLGVPIAFPNFAARKAILVAHDVHHLLTGYPTTWRGEAEIGGFEIASGCRHYWAAWMFNLGGLLFGLFIAPQRTWHGFRRGRHARNFYGCDLAGVLALPVASARQQLGLATSPPPPTRRDRLAFASWAVIVLAPVAAAAALLGALLRALAIV
jgi:hypothetical protein